MREKESSQRHLGRVQSRKSSRLNVASRMDLAMREAAAKNMGGGGREAGEKTGGESGGEQGDRERAELEIAGL